MNTQEFAPVREEFSPPPAEEFALPPAEHPRMGREYGQTATDPGRKKRSGNPLKLTTAAVVSAAVILTGTPVQNIQEDIPYIELDAAYCAQIDAFSAALEDWDKDTLCTLAEDPLTAEMMTEAIVPGLEALGYGTGGTGWREYGNQSGQEYWAHMYYDGHGIYAKSPTVRTDVQSLYLHIAYYDQDSQWPGHDFWFTNYGDKTDDGRRDTEFHLSRQGDRFWWRIYDANMVTKEVLEDGESRRYSAVADARMMYSENLSRTTSSASGERVWLIDGSFDWEHVPETDSQGGTYYMIYGPMKDGTVSLCSYDGSLGDALGGFTVADGQVVENDDVWIEVSQRDYYTNEPTEKSLCLNVNGETIVYDRWDGNGIFWNLDGRYLIFSGNLTGT